jgi:hypothetical protein
MSRLAPRCYRGVHPKISSVMQRTWQLAIHSQALACRWSASGYVSYCSKGVHKEQSHTNGRCVMCVQVKPDSSVAQRSGASGKLVLVMPKESPQQPVVDVAYLRYRAPTIVLGDTRTVFLK